MRICHTKAMKLIKEYERKKEFLIDREDENCRTSYKEGEKKILNGYNYEKTRKEIAELDEKIRAIRVTLAISNTTTKIDDFNITIGEALVLLAQLENEKSHLEDLAENKQLTRRLTSNGVIEYTESLYDTEKVKTDIEALQEKISNLQIAIDRANLTSFVEI